MSTQIFLNFKQTIISNHDKILDNLDLKYCQRISELLTQKRSIAQQIQKSFIHQLDTINQLITNSQNQHQSKESQDPSIDTNNIITTQEQQSNDDQIEDSQQPIIEHENHIEETYNSTTNLQHNYTNNDIVINKNDIQTYFSNKITINDSEFMSDNANDTNNEYIFSDSSQNNSHNQTIKPEIDIKFEANHENHVDIIEVQNSTTNSQDNYTDNNVNDIVINNNEIQTHFSNKIPINNNESITDTNDSSSVHGLYVNNNECIFSDDNSQNNSQRTIIKPEIDRKLEVNNDPYILTPNHIDPSLLIKCPQCEYKTDSKIRMEIHSRIHLTDKPFKCDTCLKTYTAKGALEVHKRTHSGAYPFKCKLCYKQFNQIPHLRYHLLSHTNEKPFICNNCKQTFKTKKSLENHIKKKCVTVDVIIKKEPVKANQLLEESLKMSRGHGLLRGKNIHDALQVKQEDGINDLVMDNVDGKRIWKGFNKAGQCFDEPDKYESCRIFYESMYAQDNQSIMAISYCIYYGCFEEEYAQQLYGEYQDVLLPYDTFDIYV
eukprot:175212_1